MHIITRRRLRLFWERYPDAEEPLSIWHSAVEKADYKTPHDVKADYGTSDFIGDKRVVFNIGGNKYRLVVRIEYRWGRVFIRHVVTHEEYDQLTKDNAL